MKKLLFVLALCLISFNSVYALYSQDVETTVYFILADDGKTLTFAFGSLEEAEKDGGMNPNKLTSELKKSVEKIIFHERFAYYMAFYNADQTNVDGFFSEFSNVREIEDFQYFNTSHITDMSYMFADLKKLEKVDLSSLITDNVTDMSFMFYNCEKLDNIDLTNWNTRNVTDMNSMFDNCKSLRTIDITSFDMGNVQRVSSMFSNCVSLTTIYCNQDWTKIGMDADETFEYCESLIGGKGTEFDENHTYIDYARPDKGSSSRGYFTNKEEVYAAFTTGGKKITFYYDYDRADNNGIRYGRNDWRELNSAELAKIEKAIFDESFKKARVENTSNWFGNFQNMTQIEHLDYLDTSADTTMASMFYNCKSLKALDLTHFNTSKVNNMNSMFYSCSLLETLNLCSFDISKVTNTKMMFSGCSALTTIYCSEDFSISELIDNSDNMFYGCTALAGGEGTAYDSGNANNADYARIDGGEEDPGYFTDPATALIETENRKRKDLNRKLVRDGMMLIENGNRTYNAAGAEMK